MVSQFVDISDFQPNVDWAQYKSWAEQGDGISRVAMRSSYGVGFTDQHFQEHRAGALAAGIDIIIFYHYAYPQYNAPLAEANWCQQVIGSIRPQDQIILDYEEDVVQSTGQWALAWLVEFSPKYGKLPGIYSYPDFIARHLQWPGLNAFPLWYANWTYNPNARPPAPAPWTSYEAIQYSDSAVNIPGIPYQVDANIFLGGNPPMIDLSMPEVANFFRQAPGNAWQCRQNGNIIGNAMLDAYRDYGSNPLKGVYYLGLPVSNEVAAGTTPGNTQQDFELGRLVYDQDGSLGGRPGQAKGVYPAHVLPQPGQASIDKAAQLLGDIKTNADTAKLNANTALSVLGK